MILALTMNIIFFISLLGIVCGTGNKDQPNASKVISLRNKDAEGTTCDWDRKWPYETRPCSGWSNNGFKLTKDSKQPNRGRYVIYENGLHKIGNSANLKSPWYRDSSGHCKLKFHVRMRHINLGRMHVWLTTLNGSRTRIWHEYADLGERWHIQKISLGSINGPFRLQFLVERGVSDRASVSLDDISLTNCTTHQHDDPDTHGCSLSEFMCNTGICIPLHQICDGMNDCLYSEDETQNCEGWKVCDFEKDTCSYTNGTSDIYWTKHSGNTPTNHTGPNSDHTLRNRRGHYLYFETTLGKLGYRGTVLSEVYQRPPSCHNNKTSPFYNSCWVRFYYHMYGAHVHTLQLHILEIDFHLPNKTISKGRYFRKVWSRVMDTKTEAEGNGLNSWIRVALPLPDVNRRFILKFEAIRGFRYLGDIAIDDISLAAECYGQGVLANVTESSETITEIFNSSTRFSFKTCSNSGRFGPTQYQCDISYKLTDKKVKVQNGNSSFPGVQVWVVPETNYYSITALGASGGTGVGNREHANGGYAHAKFNLTAGSKIYMLIGQRGEDACSQTKKNTLSSRICQHGIEPKAGNDGKDLRVGGGGGGATFVFRVDTLTNQVEMLIVAGGAGGKAGQIGQDAIRPSGGLSISGPGTSQRINFKGPGAGGSYFGSINGSKSRQSGGSLMEDGAIGGLPCDNSDFWHISGGFGGGGGGCLAGGGGGGYTGGNVSITNNKLHNGQGGSSYINPIGDAPIFEPGANQEDGEVEIAYVLDCPCEFMCIYQNYQKNKFKCYCAPNYVLHDDGLHCNDPKTYNQSKNKSSNATLFKYISIGVGLVLVTVITLSCFVKCSDRRKAIHLDHLTATDFQLDLLRNGQHSNMATGQNPLSTTGTNLLQTAYNPNYDFGGSKCTLQDLVEIKRSHLSLISALGQGAFGEVYQGTLVNKKSSEPERKVAIKTLPALCTNQSEMDFLMEALIMSKFHHENIVSFIGVCFEKHPRFIILELLEGGDLKTFLRDSRPKKENCSSLTIGNLLKLALDVAFGCLYLEENHFIHRDIAARNCLLTSKYENRQVKIADFGMARDIYRSDYYRKGGKALLPVKWMPPEAFLDGIFTLKTDIWSFGILLWEVCSMGLMPYPGHSNQEVMTLVTDGGRLEAPKNCHPLIYSIMCNCWHGISDKRPSFSSLISKLQQCLENPQICRAKIPIFPISNNNGQIDSSSIAAGDCDPSTTAGGENLSGVKPPIVQGLTSKQRRGSNANPGTRESPQDGDKVAECDTCTDSGHDTQQDGRGDTGSSPLLSSSAKGRVDQRSRHAHIDDQPPPLDYDALLTEAAQSSQKSRTPRHKPKLYLQRTFM